MDDSHPSVKAYKAALAGAPERMRGRVSEFTSTGDPTTGLWTLRDAQGDLVWQQTPPEPLHKPQPSRPEATQDARVPQLAKEISVIRKFVAIDNKLGLEAANAIARIDEVLTALVEKVDGLQKALGDGRGLSFKGEFQRALDYSEGDIVTRGERVYVAVKDIPAGDALREGMSGWVLMIKGVPQCLKT